MDGFTIGNANKFLETGSLRYSTDSLVETPKISNNSDKSFSATLNEAINQVNELQKSSDKSMQELATGRTDNVADVMIAAERADIALRTMVQVRNKIIDAYQEIMKLQV